MKAFAIEFFWNHGQISATSKNIASPMAIEYLGMFGSTGGGTGGAVSSVNGKIGAVSLSAGDVGADAAGSAAAVRGELQPQIEANALGLNSKADAVATTQALAAKANAATINQQLALKASQIALDATNQQVATNTQLLTEKADLTALAMLTALLGTKADQQYVNEQIGLLVNGDQNIIATIQAISAALEEYEDLLEALDYTVANRVRFDVATQGLNALQKYNARTNIGAEEAGTALLVMQQITVTSIGAATAAQGAKADSAVQPEQLKPVATTGAFADLSGKAGIFGIVYTGYAVGANLALAATDSLGTMLGKAQGQIDAIFLALGTKADATSTLALINQKVSSVLLGVANGVATLGSDGKVPTGQLPATSNITWQNLTIVAGATVSSDAVYPMQIGKDSRNNVYLRGMFASTKNGTLDANLPLFTIPNDFKLATTDTTTMQTIISCPIFRPLQTNPTPGYVCFRAISGVQQIGLTVALAILEKVHINEQVIGFLA